MSFLIRLIPRRILRFQLSIKFTMLFVLISGAGLSWNITKARQQANTVTAILRIGGQVSYDWEYYNGKAILGTGKPPWPDFLIRNLGPDYFANVTSVTISSTPLDQPSSLKGWLEIDDALMDRLATLRHVEWLSFDGNRSFTDAKLSKLSGLTRLLMLDLQDSGVTGSGLVHLKSMPGLEYVDLTELPLKDRDLANLSSLTNLKVIRLEGDQFTDAGLAHLKPLTNVESLFIYSNKKMNISSYGLSHLSSLYRLRLLDLQRTKIESLVSIQLLTKLQYLDLSNGSLSDGELRVLTLGFDNLEFLALNENPKITDADLAHLSKLKNLRILSLTGTSITGAGLGYLTTLSGLDFLGLKGSAITDAGVAQIKEMFYAEHIDVSNTSITDIGLELLLLKFSGKEVDVRGTKTTITGVASLQSRFSGIQIYR